ncbi:MAG: carbohydrate binding domain-containing protein [Nanoarchaeota archaeon]|nr:carbohydrate binding domain-containing protein [Patescibacteria group bacterium]MCG2717288.1 carbohydrate binding domain-containing protein [Nanoarchaeota archaeon]
MHPLKRSIIIVLLTIFILISLFFPKGVQAQLVVTDPVVAQLTIWQTVKKYVGDLIEKAWKHGGAIAYKNTINFYLGEVAKQSAEYLATGGKGKKPMFLADPSKYLHDVADAFMGDYIDRASKDILGKSLCDPIDPNIKLQLLISLDDPKMSVTQRGKCSASQVLTRLKGMTLKDLFQFEAKLSSGAPAKYKNDIKIIIASDTVLNKGQLFDVHPAARCHEDGFYMIDYDAINASCCPTTVPPPIWCEDGDSGPYVNMGVGKLLDIANDLIVAQDDFEKISVAWKSFQDGKFSERVGLIEKEIEEIIKEINILTNNTGDCSDASEKRKCSKIEKKKKKYEKTLSEIKKMIKEFESNEEAAIKKLEEIEAKIKLIKGEVSEEVDLLPTVANELAFWEKYAKSCQKKNLEDFYSESGCIVIDYLAHGIWATTETLEQDHYSDTIIYTKRIDNYTKQLVEWASILTDMVEKTKKACVDMSQVPDLNPLEDLNRMYNPESSDLGVSLGLKSDLFKKQQEQIEKSKFAQTLKGRIDDATTKISGVTKTPSTLVDESSRAAVKGSDPASMMQYTGVAMADALGVFTNTLMSKLLKRVFEMGFNKNVDPDQVDLTRPDDVASTSGTFFSDLKIASIDETKEEVNMYNEFAVCPGEGYATPTHCLIQDTSFRSAIEQGLTLKEAVDGGYLAGEDAIGLHGDTNSQLSYPVIKKLRRFRIFPLGLEIAAGKIFNQEKDESTDKLKNITKSLNQLFEDFYKPGNDYNHLVDPNWVLKSPVYQCSAKGYSSIPVLEQAFRQKLCVDLKGCIHENEQGKCDTWGYCTREKNIWKLEGNGCDEQYAGCKTYKRSEDGERFYYLSQTLNLEGCDYPGSGGCKWYCKNQDQITEEWNCLKPGQVFTFDTGADDFEPDEDLGNVIFFNSNAQKCSLKNEGCHEYISIIPNTGTNLVVNGSFKDIGADNIPDKWTVYGPIDAILQLSAISLLEEQIKISASDGAHHWVQQRINNVPALADEFVLSGKIKLVRYVSGKIGLKLVVYYTGGSSDSNSEEINTDVLDAEQDIFVHLKPDPNKIIDYVIVYGPWSNNLNGEFYGDDIQLELGSNASSYKDYGAKNKTYFKTVPDYLKTSIEWESCIDDDPANNLDIDICDKYVIECSSDEVGCELYTPFNTDPKVPGIVKDSDKCSFNCLGYETFQQMPSYFDTEPAQWVNLIPSTAKTCSFPGCEEFTNLETENREYYSYLRQCVKINAQSEVVINSDGSAVPPASADLCQFYYTWVGTETGYQLKQYYLKKADPSDPDAAVKYADDPDANGPTKVSAEPSSEWRECDIGNLKNPHCRQFYDADGNIYYRLYKNTVSCAESCSLYRRTVDQTIQMADASEGESCNKQNIGCREYKGPTAGNIKKVFSDDFESGTIEPWVGGETPPSGESVNFPGYSLEVTSGPISRPVKNLVQKDRTYFVSFWIKGTTTVSVEFTSSDDGFTKTGLNPGEWQEVKSDPFYFDTEPDDNEELTITGSNFYIDNIILKEVEDNPYLIKDSWSTPTICDQDAEGNYSLGYAIGCQVYQNRAGQNRYLKSFTRLCSENVVGCEAFIDTQNFSEPFGQTFNNGDNESPGEPNDDVTIPSHELVYFINDSNKKCSSQEVGCQKFGFPELDINQEAKQGMYKSVYLINKPDQYKSLPSLCLYQSLGCEEYDNEKSFKFPGEKICEYRENVDMGDESKTGWFQKGADDPCYSSYQTNGIYDIYSNNETGYDGWVGKCESAQSGCTEFINPLVQNLTINSSFEWGEPGSLPDSYIRNDGIPSGGFSGLVNLSDEAHGGNFSYNVDVPTNPDDDSGYYGLKHDVGIKVLPQTQYEVSAYIKTEGISGSVGLTVHCHNVDHSSGDFRYGTSEANPRTWDDGERWITTSNQDWTKVWGKFTTLADADHCHIILMFGQTSTGTAYFDSLNFVQIGSKNASYFYINNNNLDKSSCNGQVGLKDGCILLNDTSNESLIYNSVVVYADSFINDDVRINPKGDIEAGDANIIVKAKRDRVCGEWLTCTGSRYIWDPILEKWREICEFFGRCDKLIGTGQESVCGHYVIYSNPEPLTEDKYKSRDISWSGMDYSGYSIYGLYPIEVLFPKEYENNHYKLTYIEKESLLNKGIDGVGNQLEKTCKVFPEEDSPFKQTHKDEGNIKNVTYKNVNVCNETGTGTEMFPDCQCAYKKVSYAGEDRYYYYGSTSINEVGGIIPKGICISVGGTGNEKIGDPCSLNSDCSNDIYDPGICVKKTKSVSAIGLRGFCLEKDKSWPDENYCLTWWLGSGIGDPDIYMSNRSAAFTPTHTWYCQENIEAGPHWEDVTGDHCDSGVGKGARDPVQCEHEEYYITTLPEVRMKEVEKIRVRIGVDDAAGQCSWEHLDSNGYHNLTRAAPEGVPDVGHNDPAWTSNEEDDSSGNNYFDCGCDKGGACIKIKACFGSDCGNDHPDDVLHHFVVKQIDRSYGKSSARFDEADIYLKDGCKYTIEISTDNKGIAQGAYTNRLWTESSYKADSGSDTFSWYTTKCIPYGAVGSSSVDRLILVANESECYVDEANVVHSETSLKSLFAKVNERKEFFTVTGIVTPGICLNGSPGWCTLSGGECFIDENCFPDEYYEYYGPCNKTESDPCFDDDGVEIECPGDPTYSPCDKNEECFDDEGDEIECCVCDNKDIIACGENTDCYERDSCEDVTLRTCSNNPNINCINDSYCTFTTSGMIYNTVTGSWDETESESSTDNAPTIASVDMSTCDENDICGTAGLNEITINGMNDTEITKSKSYPVSLKFFVWADKNQMPIRNITIDWIGDESDPAKIKLYDVILKNYKPSCGISPDDFGDSAGACTKKYLSFTYIYSCEGENSPGYGRFTAENPKCATNCCFKPTVYAKDNWGWCDGGGTGFYVNENEKCIDIGAGTSYKQLIIIEP